jgi:hypothetical protein
MSGGPRGARVTVNADELQKLQNRYEERIDTQRVRLNTMLAFLEEHDLVNKFNEWETARGE